MDKSTEFARLLQEMGHLIISKEDVDAFKKKVNEAFDTAFTPVPKPVVKPKKWFEVELNSKKLTKALNTLNDAGVKPEHIKWYVFNGSYTTLNLVYFHTEEVNLIAF